MTNDRADTTRPAGRVLTPAEINGVSGGKGKVTKAQAVAQANATADTMIAILKKYHVI